MCSVQSAYSILGCVGFVLFVYWYDIFHILLSLLPGLEVLDLCPQCTDILYSFLTFKKLFPIQNLHLSGRMIHQLSVCKLNVHFTGWLVGCVKPFSYGTVL
jgi:hypothetical protein